jgi:microcystin degradation protein MlrC
VVLSDLADGTGAGSPGDATAVLAALLEAKPDRPALIWIYDPEVAAAAAAIGVGGTIDTLVGAKRDTIYNQPVRFVGRVELARPASYTFGGQGYTGIQMDMGLSVVLRHGQIQLLVTSKSVMTVDPALFRAVGLEPGAAQIVVVKSHIQFRAGYAGLARGIIMLDSPGMSSDHLVALDFRRVDRPLFPLDPGVVWRVQPSAEKLT